jgi:DNA-binding transcriptional LysR family regulator
MLARDLPLLPVFVSVVRHGSFTGAAKELGVAKSVVSQHIRTLEERCGVRLIERTTRRLRLTQIGGEVLVAATAVVDAAKDVDRLVAAHHSAPTGTLRITAPQELGGTLVAPVAAEIARLHPALRVEIELDDHPRDLVGEGFDVALRLGVMGDSGHVARRLGWEPEIIVGAAELVAVYADADRPAGLRGAPWVVHSPLGAGKVWKFRSEDANAKEDEVVVAPRALASSVESVRALVIGGVGFALLPRHVVAVDIAEGRLEHVCPAWFHRRISLYALLPGRKNPPRVTLFLDHLASAVPRFGFRSGKA